MAYYKQHLYFCTNFREEGKTCCQTGGNASDMCRYTKEKLKDLNLHGPGKVRVSYSGCMGRCNDGPTLVVYPDAVWYRYKTQADIDLIIEQHICGGEVVEALLMAQQ